MTLADRHILTVNGGSSSIKLALFESSGLRPAGSAEIERIGSPGCAFRTTSENPSEARSRPITPPDSEHAIAALLAWLGERGDRLIGVGHRVVHGGPTYSAPVRITDEVRDELRRLVPFDPDHLPEELQLIDAFRKRFSELPHVACFDTAFHHDLPRVAKLLPIPRRYEAKGVRRYGFHGLSYTFLMAELARVAGADVARGRIVLAHLGSGASLAAVRDGASIDTSMSFTPTGGVPMGTRSGDLDPGVLSYLARTEHLDPSQLDKLVNARSGLLGMSETSSDLRDLLANETNDVRAAEAVAVFCYQVKKWIGGFAAALGGLDTLVFAGGIGEHAAVVRTRICDGLGFLGLELDADSNAADAAVISAATSRVTVRVMRTDEAIVIGGAVRTVLGLH
ncbi:MAG: acetate/propionate family kinase [Kofleriaceae bacterium]